MDTQKLSSVDAFVVRDLPDADRSVGAVRVAPKILAAGAKEMARSMTYRYALLNQKIGGASAGINAKPDARAEAIAAFSSELLPQVTEGTLHMDATGAVPPEGLAELQAADHRNDIRLTPVQDTVFADRLSGLGAHAAADEALGGIGAMKGQRVVIEGFGTTGPTLAAAADAYGAKIIAVSTSKGSVGRADGFDPLELIQAHATHGAEFVQHLGDEAKPANHGMSHECDVFYAGSKMGVANHTAAEFLNTRVLVPTGPVPYTTKAVLMLHEKGCLVLPDFMTTAGPAFAEWAAEDASVETIEEEATTSIRQLTGAVIGPEHGPTLEACYRAESHLRSWRDALPFGRPFAA